MNILVTGGAGFIGSALIRYLIKNTNHKILNIDKLTYAGNLKSLQDIDESSNYSFKKVDIINQEQMTMAFDEFQPDIVFHLAAETHVDNSIDSPLEFINTNVFGTAVLLDVSYHFWKKCDQEKRARFKFHHISTDEVYGSLKPDEFFTEDSSYDPSSPYSASKASSDHLVRSWRRTFKLPILITNCSNNYGPHQFPEKLIPLIILNAIQGKPLPIYGDGLQVRDWLYVDDHVEALYKVMQSGELGQTYNIGGNNQKTNLDVVNGICELLDGRIDPKKYELSSFKELITFVKDRPGHDTRYAMDISKITKDIGWHPKESFKSGLSKTVDWYLDFYGE
jgi:dTDP-glucose 4,6-dehydratase